MMFLMHISATLTLGVLLASAALINWSQQSKAKGLCFVKKVGYFVFGASVLSLLCIGYYSYKYWSQGEFETSRPMHMGMHHKMMQNMGDMMGGMMGKMENGEQQSGEDHAAHHPKT